MDSAVISGPELQAGVNPSVTGAGGGRGWGRPWPCPSQDIQIGSKKRARGWRLQRRLVGGARRRSQEQGAGVWTSPTAARRAGGPWRTAVRALASLTSPARRAGPAGDFGSLPRGRLRLQRISPGWPRERGTFGPSRSRPALAREGGRRPEAALCTPRLSLFSPVLPSRLRVLLTTT